MTDMRRARSDLEQNDPFRHGIEIDGLVFHPEKQGDKLDHVRGVASAPVQNELFFPSHGKSQLLFTPKDRNFQMDLALFNSEFISRRKIGRSAIQMH